MRNPFLVTSLRSSSRKDVSTPQFTPPIRPVLTRHFSHHGGSRHFSRSTPKNAIINTAWGICPEFLPDKVEPDIPLVCSVTFCPHSESPQYPDQTTSYNSNRTEYRNFVLHHPFEDTFRFNRSMIRSVSRYQGTLPRHSRLLMLLLPFTLLPLARYLRSPVFFVRVYTG